MAKSSSMMSHVYLCFLCIRISLYAFPVTYWAAYQNVNLTTQLFLYLLWIFDLIFLYLLVPFVVTCVPVNRFFFLSLFWENKTLKKALLPSQRYVFHSEFAMLFPLSNCLLIYHSYACFFLLPFFPTDVKSKWNFAYRKSMEKAHASRDEYWICLSERWTVKRASNRRQNIN